MSNTYEDILLLDISLYNYDEGENNVYIDSSWYDVTNVIHLSKNVCRLHFVNDGILPFEYYLIDEDKETFKSVFGDNVFDQDTISNYYSNRNTKQYYEFSHNMMFNADTDGHIFLNGEYRKTPFYIITSDNTIAKLYKPEDTNNMILIDICKISSLSTSNLLDKLYTLDDTYRLDKTTMTGIVNNSDGFVFRVFDNYDIQPISKFPSKVIPYMNQINVVNAHSFVNGIEFIINNNINSYNDVFFYNNESNVKKSNLMSLLSSSSFDNIFENQSLEITFSRIENNYTIEYSNKTYSLNEPIYINPMFALKFLWIGKDYMMFYPYTPSISESSLELINSYETLINYYDFFTNYYDNIDTENDIFVPSDTFKTDYDNLRHIINTYITNDQNDLINIETLNNTYVSLYKILPKAFEFVPYLKYICKQCIDDNTNLTQLKLTELTNFTNNYSLSNKFRVYSDDIFVSFPNNDNTTIIDSSQINYIIHSKNPLMIFNENTTIVFMFDDISYSYTFELYMSDISDIVDANGITQQRDIAITKLIIDNNEYTIDDDIIIIPDKNITCKFIKDGVFIGILIDNINYDFINDMPYELIHRSIQSSVDLEQYLTYIDDNYNVLQEILKSDDYHTKFMSYITNYNSVFVNSKGVELRNSKLYYMIMGNTKELDTPINTNVYVDYYIIDKPLFNIQLDTNTQDTPHQYIMITSCSNMINNDMISGSMGIVNEPSEFTNITITTARNPIKIDFTMGSQPSIALNDIVIGNDPVEFRMLLNNTVEDSELNTPTYPDSHTTVNMLNNYIISVHYVNKQTFVLKLTMIDNMSIDVNTQLFNRFKTLHTADDKSIDLKSYLLSTSKYVFSNNASLQEYIDYMCLYRNKFIKPYALVKYLSIDHLVRSNTQNNIDMNGNCYFCIPVYHEQIIQHLYNGYDSRINGSYYATQDGVANLGNIHNDLSNLKYSDYYKNYIKDYEHMTKLDNVNVSYNNITDTSIATNNSYNGIPIVKDSFVTANNVNIYTETMSSDILNIQNDILEYYTDTEANVTQKIYTKTKSISHIIPYTSKFNYIRNHTNIQFTDSNGFSNKNYLHDDVDFNYNVHFNNIPVIICCNYNERFYIASDLKYKYEYSTSFTKNSYKSNHTYITVNKNRSDELYVDFSGNVNINNGFVLNTENTIYDNGTDTHIKLLGYTNLAETAQSNQSMLLMIQYPPRDNRYVLDKYSIPIDKYITNNSLLMYSNGINIVNEFYNHITLSNDNLILYNITSIPVSYFTESPNYPGSSTGIYPFKYENPHSIEKDIRIYYDTDETTNSYDKINNNYSVIPVACEVYNDTENVYYISTEFYRSNYVVGLLGVQDNYKIVFYNSNDNTQIVVNGNLNKIDVPVYNSQIEVASTVDYGDYISMKHKRLTNSIYMGIVANSAEYNNYALYVSFYRPTFLYINTPYKAYNSEFLWLINNIGSGNVPSLQYVLTGAMDELYDINYINPNLYFKGLIEKLKLNPYINDIVDYRDGFDPEKNGTLQYEYNEYEWSNEKNYLIEREIWKIYRQREYIYPRNFKITNINDQDGDFIKYMLQYKEPLYSKSLLNDDVKVSMNINDNDSYVCLVDKNDDVILTKEEHNNKMIYILCANDSTINIKITNAYLQQDVIQLDIHDGYIVCDSNTYDLNKYSTIGRHIIAKSKTSNKYWLFHISAISVIYDNSPKTITPVTQEKYSCIIGGLLKEYTPVSTRIKSYEFLHEIPNCTLKINEYIDYYINKAYTNKNDFILYLSKYTDKFIPFNTAYEPSFNMYLLDNYDNEIGYNTIHESIFTEDTRSVEYNNYFTNSYDLYKNENMMLITYTDDYNTIQSYIDSSNISYPLLYYMNYDYDSTPLVINNFEDLSNNGIYDNIDYTTTLQVFERLDNGIDYIEYSQARKYETHILFAGKSKIKDVLKLYTDNITVKEQIDALTENQIIGFEFTRDIQLKTREPMNTSWFKVMAGFDGAYLLLHKKYYYSNNFNVIRLGSVDTSNGVLYLQNVIQPMLFPDVNNEQELSSAIINVQNNLFKLQKNTMFTIHQSLMNDITSYIKYINPLIYGIDYGAYTLINSYATGATPVYDYNTMMAVLNSRATLPDGTIYPSPLDNVHPNGMMLAADKKMYLQNQLLKYLNKYNNLLTNRYSYLPMYYSEIYNMISFMDNSANNCDYYPIYPNEISNTEYFTIPNSYIRHIVQTSKDRRIIVLLTNIPFNTDFSGYDLFNHNKFIYDNDTTQYYEITKHEHLDYVKSFYDNYEIVPFLEVRNSLTTSLDTLHIGDNINFTNQSFKYVSSGAGVGIEIFPRYYETLHNSSNIISLESYLTSIGNIPTDLYQQILKYIIINNNKFTTNIINASQDNIDILKSFISDAIQHSIFTVLIPEVYKYNTLQDVYDDIETVKYKVSIPDYLIDNCYIPIVNNSIDVFMNDVSSTVFVTDINIDDFIIVGYCKLKVVYKDSKCIGLFNYGDVLDGFIGSSIHSVYEYINSEINDVSLRPKFINKLLLNFENNIDVFDASLLNIDNINIGNNVLYIVPQTIINNDTSYNIINISDYLLNTVINDISVTLCINTQFSNHTISYKSEYMYDLNISDTCITYTDIRKTENIIDISSVQDNSSSFYLDDIIIKPFYIGNSIYLFNITKTSYYDEHYINNTTISDYITDISSLILNDKPFFLHYLENNIHKYGSVFDDGTDKLLNIIGITYSQQDNIYVNVYNIRYINLLYDIINVDIENKDMYMYLELSGEYTILYSKYKISIFFNNDNTYNVNIYDNNSNNIIYNVINQSYGVEHHIDNFVNIILNNPQENTLKININTSILKQWLPVEINDVNILLNTSIYENTISDTDIIYSQINDENVYKVYGRFVDGNNSSFKLLLNKQYDNTSVINDILINIESSSSIAIEGSLYNLPMKSIITGDYEFNNIIIKYNDTYNCYFITFTMKNLLQDKSYEILNKNNKVSLSTFIDSTINTISNSDVDVQLYKDYIKNHRSSFTTLIEQIDKTHLHTFLKSRRINQNFTNLGCLYAIPDESFTVELDLSYTSSLTNGNNLLTINSDNANVVLNIDDNTQIIYSVSGNNIIYDDNVYGIGDKLNIPNTDYSIVFEGNGSNIISIEKEIFPPYSEFVFNYVELSYNIINDVYVYDPVNTDNNYNIINNLFLITLLQTDVNKKMKISIMDDSYELTSATNGIYYNGVLYNKYDNIPFGNYDIIINDIFVNNTNTRVAYNVTIKTYLTEFTKITVENDIKIDLSNYINTIKDTITTQNKSSLRQYLRRNITKLSSNKTPINADVYDKLIERKYAGFDSSTVEKILYIPNISNEIVLSKADYEDIINNNKLLHIDADVSSTVVFNIDSTKHEIELFEDSIKYNNNIYGLGDTVILDTYKYIVVGFGSVSLLGDGIDTQNGNGNGNGNSQNNIPCFTKGTRILTKRGYINVEKLTQDDLLILSDKRKVMIRNIYRTIVNETTTNTAPYCIKKGAYGRNMPNRDVVLSGMHAFTLKPDVWKIPCVEAKYNKKVIQAHLGERVEYYHIETDNYLTDNVIVEGMVMETYGKAIKDLGYVVQFKYINKNNFQRIIVNKKSNIRIQDL